MGQILRYKHGLDSVSHVDQRLWDIVQHAIAAQPYDAIIRSGSERVNDKGNHSGGFAVDVTLVDPSTGEALPDHYFDNSGNIIDGAPEAYQAYENYAQAARVYQQETYSELDDTFRWGGGFQQGGTPGDMMHLDITPSAHGAMANYSWARGYIGGDNLPGAVSNGGLGGAEGARRVSQISQQLAGGPIPPAGMASDAPVPLARPASLSAPVSLGGGAINGSNTQATGSASLAPMPRPRPEPTLQTLAPPNLPLNPEMPTGLPQGNWNSRDTPQAGMLGRGLPSLNASGALGQQTSASSGAALGPSGTLTASGTAQPSNAAATGVASLTAAPAAVAPTPLARPIIAAVAPTPMPSRPADTAPTRTAAAPAAPANVRLASGQMIAPGLYPDDEGHAWQVADDGTGNAKITKVLAPGEIPGVINPLREVNANTVAGGVIRSAIGNAVGDATNTATSSLTEAAKSVPGVDTATSALGQIGNLFSGALGSFGGGGTPSTSQGSTASRSATSTLQNIHDSNDDAIHAGGSAVAGRSMTSPDNVNASVGFNGSAALGAPSPSGAAALGNSAAATAKPTVTYRTETNPAYTEWARQYGDVSVTPLAVTTLQDIHDQNDDRIVAASSSQSTPKAPAKTIQVAVRSSGGGTSSGGSTSASSSGNSAAAAPQTFQGTSTGNTYVVGQTYSNGNGTYIAQADGTFQRV